MPIDFHFKEFRGTTCWQHFVFGEYAWARNIVWLKPFALKRNSLHVRGPKPFQTIQTCIFISSHGSILDYLLQPLGSLDLRPKQNEGSDPVCSRRAQPTQPAPPWPGKPRPLCPRRLAVKLGLPELWRISLEILCISSDLIEKSLSNVDVQYIWKVQNMKAAQIHNKSHGEIVWEYVQIYVEDPQCVAVPENWILPTYCWDWHDYVFQHSLWPPHSHCNWCRSDNGARAHGDTSGSLRLHTPGKSDFNSPFLGPPCIWYLAGN